MIILILYKRFSINGKIYNITPIGNKIYTDLVEAKNYMKQCVLKEEDIIEYRGYKFEATISNSIQIILEPLQTFLTNMSKPNIIYYPSYEFDIQKISLPPFNEKMIEILKDNINKIDEKIKNIINKNKDISLLIYNLLYQLDSNIVDNNIIINLYKDLESNKDIIRSILINIIERNTSTIFTICLYPQLS